MVIVALGLGLVVHLVRGVVGALVQGKAVPQVRLSRVVIVEHRLAPVLVVGALVKDKAVLQVRLNVVVTGFKHAPQVVHGEILKIVIALMAVLEIITMTITAQGRAARTHQMTAQTAHAAVETITKQKQTFVMMEKIMNVMDL